jgi:hypothetical protein
MGSKIVCDHGVEVGGMRQCPACGAELKNGFWNPHMIGLSPAEHAALKDALDLILTPGSKFWSQSEIDALVSIRIQL